MSNDAGGRRVPLECQPALVEAVYAAAATLSGSTSATLSRAPAPAHALNAPSSQQQQQDKLDHGDTADESNNAASPRRSKSLKPGTLAKRRISFQHKWLSKYALRITSMDAVTSEVLVLACRLCEKFGREKVLVADDGTPKTKRRRSTTVKHFKPPWRSDNIAHHARDQHGRRFAEYDRLTEKQKEVFLEYTGPPQTEIIAVAPRPGALTVSPSTPYGADSVAAAVREQLSQYAPLSSTSSTPVSTAPELAIAPAPAAPSHSASSYDRVVCLIDASIIDTVVADALIDSDSPYGALVHDAAQAVAVFTRASGGGRSLDRVTYTVNIPSRRAFESCLEFVATGAALTQCAALVNDAQVRLTIGAITTATVVGFVRMATAMNLQVLATILERTWAFSLVLDGSSSNNSEPSSVMVRVRVALGTSLRDVHVLALPATERHVRIDIYATLAKLLTAVYEGYERKLVGIVTLGPPRVTARLADVVAQLHASTSDGCYCIWSGAQHVARVVERVLEQLFDEASVRRMSALVGYLRAQRELTAALHGDVCPRFVDTRLVSLTRLIDWFSRHRTDVKSYVDTKQPACAPDASWWVLMAALKRYCDIVTRTLSTLIGATAALGQQRASINALLAELMDVGFVRGPFDNVYALGGASEPRPFVFGAYAVTHDAAAAVLENLDPFVFELVEVLKTAGDGPTPAGNTVYAALVARVAFVFGESVSALASVLQSHDAVAPVDAGQSGAVPSVLPHELVQLSGADMNRLLRTQQLRLLVTFTKDETSAIHSEHAALKTAYTRDATFKAQLDRMTSAWSFERAWSSVGELYPRLQTFCAGLATAFPDVIDSSNSSKAHTRVVTRAYERSASRTSLVDFSLEAMLQAQQYATLQDVATSMGF